MTARVFVHPKCLTGPRSLEAAAFLQEQGYDMRSKWQVHPPQGARRTERYELVALVGHRQDHSVYRRFNGEPFKHYHPQPAVA